MIGLTHERLTKISLTTNPYRGSTNRYPIGKRTDNNKFLLAHEENGERVFDVVYSYDYKQAQATQYEYDMCELSGKGNVRRVQNLDSDQHEYIKFVKTPNVIGRVRPDNSFEFTAHSIGQGDRSVLSNWCHGWFLNDSRRGGMIYRDNRAGHLIPIFKGLRVDCNTMKPITEYEVIGKKVNRKASRELLSKYEHFYKVSEVMFKAMEWNTFIALAVEISEEVTPEAKHPYRNGKDREILRAEALKRKDESPIDAAILFMLAEDVGRMQWNAHAKMMNPQKNYSYDASTPEELFFCLKRTLNKRLYKQHESVFKPVTYSMGERFPPSEWGITVTVNGEEVEQYGYAG